MKFTEEEQVAVDDAVKKFLNSGIIEHSPSQEKSYLSKSFTVKEPNKRRPILDCTNLSQYIQCNHFKMKGVLALLELLDKNDYMCKIDLKDAYVVVPIHENSRDYLTSLHQNVVYRYKNLAFGLNVIPRIFSKLMEHALEPLCKTGIRFVFYLDDVCVLGKTKEEMQENTTISSEPGTEAIMIGISMTSNQTVAEVEEEDEVVTHPSTFNWLSSLLFPYQDK